MSKTGRTGSARTPWTHDHRSDSLVDVCPPRRRGVPPWRWAPVVAIPLLVTSRGGRPWLAVHPPPRAAAVAPASTAPPRPDAPAPVPMNAQVAAWVHRFRTDQRPLFQALLDQEGVYGGLIRRKLRQRGMPSDLLYLAMMESGLSPRAVSDASAVGVWQLMVPTALQYGLRVDAWVDERRDPVRATDAALDYLQALYERYDSWNLAAAAYNAGPGRVDWALAPYAGKQEAAQGLYWKVIDRLPRETRQYVPRMLAATFLARHAAEFGFTKSDVAPYRYQRVFVPGGTTLASVARTVHVETHVLRTLNPQLIRGVTPPGEAYPVRVPPGTAHSVVALLDKGAPGAPTG